jgi:hypothetical protein
MTRIIFSTRILSNLCTNGVIRTFSNVRIRSNTSVSMLWPVFLAVDGWQAMERYLLLGNSNFPLNTNIPCINCKE